MAKKVFKGSLTEKLKIDASFLPSGAYYLTLSGRNELKDSKVDADKM